MPVNTQALILGMVVVLGVVMIAQGSLAIQTYDTLQDCAKGDDSAKAKNHIQIGLLIAGVAVLCIGLGFSVKMLRSSKPPAQ